MSKRIWIVAFRLEAIRPEPEDFNNRQNQTRDENTSEKLTQSELRRTSHQFSVIVADQRESIERELNICEIGYQTKRIRQVFTEYNLEVLRKRPKSHPRAKH